MPDLPAILDAIRERPDDGARWLALARWPLDNGREDEAAAVRVFWPTMRDHVVEAEVSAEASLAEVARNAKVLCRAARQIEGKAADWANDRAMAGFGPDADSGPCGGTRARLLSCS